MRSVDSMGSSLKCQLNIWLCFSFSTIMDSRRLEFRIGVHGLTGGGCGQNLACYLSSLKCWIAVSSIVTSTLIF